MVRLTGQEVTLIGLVLEGFCYGLYSGMFAIYLQYRASKKETNIPQNILFSSVCALYVLSTVVFFCDIASPVHQLLAKPSLAIYLVEGISFSFCDFIAQFILIYRCWIVWGRNIRVVIIPSILAFAFLGTWLTATGSQYILSGVAVTPAWTPSVVLTSLSLSLTVNALVTGLIVFRILKVSQGVKATSGNKVLDATGGNRLRRVIFILIESGSALFSIQLIRLVLTIMWTDTAIRGFEIIVGSYEMFTGITPTIIIVRTSMGLSFHDEKSMEEVASGSLRVASSHPLSVPETGSITIVGQDSREVVDIDSERSNDFDTVER